MHRLSIVFLVLLFLFSCNRHLVVREINTRNITVNSQAAPVDSVLESMVKPYRDSLEKDMNTLVAISATPLVKGKPESKLTNLVADILLDFGTAYAKKQQLNMLPDASYVNYGGLRASLPQGEITVQRIFELMPFENELVMVELSGTDFMQMAGKIASRGGEGVAGFRMGIRDGMAAILTVRGKVIDPQASYWVVTSDYIANGGDQMSMFANARQRINTGTKIRDELIRALTVRYRESGIIDAKEDGRIYHEQ
ncbi:MAG TPA: 5'-nucleotidase C-terminal domain-containing protein [Prolixibacteraceae bacterium]|nr:5'-nucleotidase C-terminal domain-containing protein [Prolixibacteraceae bacterium]